MQAKLPDINAAFVKYRSYALQCIEIGNFSGAIGGLYNMNALLPDEYRIDIDTNKYLNLISEQRMLVCNECKNEFNFKDIKEKTRLLDSFESALKGQDYEITWKCKKCNNENVKSKTKVIKSSLNKPYYLKVVEEPPEKLDGVEHMMNYKKKIKKWFYNFLGELEYQIGLYRKEYTSQTEENEGNLDDDGKEEEYD